MRLIFAFAITLSFLAGQACGNGVRVFQPLKAEEHGEQMSRMIVRCGMEQEVAAGTAADCGPGKCVESAKDEPDDVSAAAARMDILCPPVSAGIAQKRAQLLALRVTTRAIPEPSRPVPDVRRE